VPVVDSGAVYLRGVEERVGRVPLFGGLSSPVNRTEFLTLADVRLVEAKALLAAGLFAGAYYLSGYAVECALKACIARQTREGDFPDKERALAVRTHDLVRLARAGGLYAAIQQECGARAPFSESWTAVAQWTEASRYNPIVSQQVAAKLVAAVGSEADGVLPWLRKSS